MFSNHCTPRSATGRHCAISPFMGVAMVEERDGTEAGRAGIQADRNEAHSRNDNSSEVESN
jgi:hypothetical protein